MNCVGLTDTLTIPSACGFRYGQALHPMMYVRTLALLSNRQALALLKLLGAGLPNFSRPNTKLQGQYHFRPLPAALAYQVVTTFLFDSVTFTFQRNHLISLLNG